MLMSNQGEHLILDLYDCDPEILDDYEGLEAILREALVISKATVLQVIGHKFDPVGVTLLALLAESHASIHTWPPENYAAVDVYTCGDSVNTYKAGKYIEERLWAKRVVERNFSRRTCLDN